MTQFDQLAVFIGLGIPTVSGTLMVAPALMTLGDEHADEEIRIGGARRLRRKIHVVGILGGMARTAATAISMTRSGLVLSMWMGVARKTWIRGPRPVQRLPCAVDVVLVAAATCTSVTLAMA